MRNNCLRSWRNKNRKQWFQSSTCLHNRPSLKFYFSYDEKKLRRCTIRHRKYCYAKQRRVQKWINNCKLNQGKHRFHNWQWPYTWLWMPLDYLEVHFNYRTVLLFFQTKKKGKLITILRDKDNKGTRFRSALLLPVLISILLSSAKFALSISYLLGVSAPGDLSHFPFSQSSLSKRPRLFSPSPLDACNYQK